MNNGRRRPFPRSECWDSPEFLASLGPNANKRIVGGLQNERGHGDAVYHIRRRGACVVIIGALKSAVESGDLVIKFAQALHAAQPGRIECRGKQPSLFTQPAAQVPQKVAFVEAVAGEMQRIGGGRQIHRRTNRCYRAEFPWSAVAPFASQLEHKIAAHGVARQRKARNVILLDDVARHCGNIRRAPGMIERGSERIGAAAIALVHADHIHAGGQSLLRDAQHVFRFAGALQTMHDDDGQRILPVRLPMALAQHADAGLDFDQAFLVRRQREMATEQEAANGLQMPAAQKSPG